ncbi:hypothetical protein AAU61_08605 [Desulfocarbo indianensis]|nr:hypothetical protein AAU61_08605 [Desulfocarbo indianensis]
MQQPDQDIAAIFQRPGLYPHAVGAVEHVQTHISHVFLTGSHAYKLKKPLNLGFLDFSTLEARTHFCREELRLNRRLAPEVYLAVLGLVSREGDYRLVPLEEAGENLIEPVLQMRQMDRARQMDRLLGEGRVEQDQVRELARLLADFYQKAQRGREVAHFGRPAQIRFNVEENFSQTEDYQEVTISQPRWRAIRDYSLAFLDARQDLLAERVRGGFIVDGHGDLHSGNINLPAGDRPIVFDCIEFNQRFRYQDAACDVSFLAMDLDYHQRPDLSAALEEEYVRASGDEGFAALVNFYKCYRAVVRAKVYGFEIDDQSVPPEQKFTDVDKARAYFRLAADYAGRGGHGEPPYFLVCLMGLMGTGKSYLAGKLAARLGWMSVNSDVLRKRLAGMRPEESSPDDWGQGLYGPRLTGATYDALHQAAGGRLAIGDSMIVDASFRADQERRRFVDLALALGAKPLLIEVRTSRQVAAQRLKRRQARGGAVSDGRLELYDQQAASWEPFSPETGRYHMMVDGGAPAEEKIAAVLAKLEELGHGG